MSRPRFSIVMPTYNRADTLGRAVASVLAQRFTDWELVLVDDGSTDATPALVAGLDDPRIVAFRQENQGVAGARNSALRAARGELIAFLDSDDEWPPHHLALMAAFFEAFPRESLVTSEWWEIFGPGRKLRHFAVEIAEWYPHTAARIGSARFLGPAPHGDPLLRVYATREPLGDWASAALAEDGFGPQHRYRGDVFDAWRWGWLTALQPTVLTRELFERAGLFDESYRIASDFPWLANLCRLAPLNLLSVPGCYKHELASGGERPAESHLVTGTHAVRFHEDVLRATLELFADAAVDDPELQAIVGFRHYLAGHWALIKGQRRRALEHLEQAIETYGGADVEAALWLARLPPDAVAGPMYRASLAAVRLPHRVRAAVHRLYAGARA